MEPHGEVLSRDNTEKAKVLELFGGLLDDAVNFGTHLFTWCLESRPVKPSNLVISAILHQFVETLDGAAVLARESCTEPLKLVLRSALESFLGLGYMLEADTDRRALCYRLAAVKRRLKELRRLDTSTPEGLEYRTLLQKDKSGFTIGDAMFRDTSKALLDLEATLGSEEETRKVAAEWEVVRSKLRNPPWYSLFGGPANLKELSIRLNHPSWYLVLYEDWSGTMHARDALGRVEIDPQTQEGTIRGLRHPGDLQVLTSIGSSMAISTYRRTAEGRVPNRLPDFFSWYSTIRVPYQRVSDADPLIRFRASGDTVDPEFL